MGGGESDDRDMREPGVSWWEEEMPNAEEIKTPRIILKTQIIM